MAGAFVLGLCSSLKPVRCCSVSKVMILAPWRSDVNHDKLNSSRPSKVEGVPPVPICNRCGAVMAIVRTMLNSTTGKTIRMFECTCGERAWPEGC